jgi:hypothetical protein
VIRVESNDESMPVVTVPALLEVVDTVVSGSISVPDEMLPVPAEGDTVTMDIELVNPTSRGRQVEVWLTLLRPGEQEPRQILEVSSIRLAPKYHCKVTHAIYTCSLEPWYICLDDAHRQLPRFSFLFLDLHV